MAEVSALTWVLKVGGSYDLIAGQTDGRMSLSHAPIEITSKDSSDDREIIGGVHSWTFSADFEIDESDTGFGALWTAWNGKTTLAARFTTPGGDTFTGSTYITDLTYSGPYNGVFVGSLTLEGTGTLTKA